MIRKRSSWTDIILLILISIQSQFLYDQYIVTGERSDWRLVYCKRKHKVPFGLAKKNSAHWFNDRDNSALAAFTTSLESGNCLRYIIWEDCFRLGISLSLLSNMFEKKFRYNWKMSIRTRRNEYYQYELWSLNARAKISMGKSFRY